MSLILAEASDVKLLREMALWFLESQDPELNDAVYDRNDEYILRTMILPRLKAPFDLDGGTCKDKALLVQVLRTALDSAGGLIDERRGKAEHLITRFVT